MSGWIAVCLGVAVIALSGCASAPQVADSMAPMLAVRLATVAAVQGDPARAQRVVAECDALIAQVDAGESIALDVLTPLLQTRIAEAALKPAERAVLLELVSVAALAVQAPDVLPDGTRERLRAVRGWVRAAALAQAA
jgi:hypothetical protein